LAPGVKDKKLVSFTRDALKEKDAVTGIIRSIVATSNPAQRSAFHVFDLNKVLDLFSAWRRALPDVRPTTPSSATPSRRFSARSPRSARDSTAPAAPR
jgi:ornithine decarboxylase